ncbi:hypothetical protein JOM56_007786 [Amanita muscaria]
MQSMVCMFHLFNVFIFPIFCPFCLRVSEDAWLYARMDTMKILVISIFFFRFFYAMFLFFLLFPYERSVFKCI